MAHTHTCTAATHTRCIREPFPCRRGNGKFCKCKSAGLKIQHINVHHMWHSGTMEDILTEQEGGGVKRGGPQSWGFSSNGEGDTRAHTQTHTRLPRDDTPERLVFFFKLYLELSPQTPPWSRAGSCARRGASSPLRRRDTSPGSACPPAAAPGPIAGLQEGGERESGLIVQLIHTHSPCRPEHPDCFRSAVGKTSTSLCQKTSRLFASKQGEAPLLCLFALFLRLWWLFCPKYLMREYFSPRLPFGPASHSSLALSLSEMIPCSP